MEKETPIKRRHRLNGVKDGVSFTKDNQPSPELKKAGWQELRKQRHLTQEIIKMMIDDDGKPTKTFIEFKKALINNANKGNPKAIDVINKCLEDEIIKVAATNVSGEDVEPFRGMIIL